MTGSLSLFERCSFSTVQPFFSLPHTAPFSTPLTLSAATLFPHLLALSGVKIPAQTDFCRLMTGAPVLLHGAVRPAVMWFGVSAIILTAWAAWRWECGRE